MTSSYHIGADVSPDLDSRVRDQMDLSDKVSRLFLELLQLLILVQHYLLSHLSGKLLLEKPFLLNRDWAADRRADYVEELGEPSAQQHGSGVWKQMKYPAEGCEEPLTAANAVGEEFLSSRGLLH